MHSFNDIFEDSYRFSLKSLNYSGIEGLIDHENNTLEFRDMINVRNLVGQELNVEFSRELRFPKSENNTLSIVFDSIYTLKKGIIVDDSLRAELPDVLADTNCSSEIYTRASMLISQIILLGTSNTLILPPQYCGSTQQ